MRRLESGEAPSFSLERNAKVGEAFRSAIRAFGSAEVEIVEILLPDGIGIDYDGRARLLCGTPSKAGEFDLPIRYRYPHASSDRTLLEGRCRLTVNPDPRSLWRQLPSDREAPGWKPDEDKQHLQGSGERRLAAASKRGRSHAHVGGFREDDFFLAVSAGSNVLVLADGAGSAKMARRASQIAVQEAGGSLLAALGKERGQKLEQTIGQSASRSPSDRDAAKRSACDILGGAALQAAKAIEREAGSAGLPIQDYSTTLILGVHKKTRHGHLLASYWVGDGGVAVYRKGRGVEVLGQADSGEFAGQTRFLDSSIVQTGDAIVKRIRVTLVPDFTAMVLMTDGISDARFETDRDLHDAACWDRFWGEIEPLLADSAPSDRLLEWLDFWSAGNHDDRTIAVLW